MGAMPTEYHTRRRRLASVLMNAGVISADPTPTLPLLRFNFDTPPLTETLAVAVARCIQQIIIMESMEFDAIACISPSEPIAKILARLVEKNERKCIFLREYEHAGKKRVSELLGEAPRQVKKVLLVNNFTLSADSEREAIQFLRHNGIEVSDAISFVDFDQGAQSELQDWRCILRPLFSANELRDLYAARRDKALSA